jgi:hypothetical protein
MLLLCFVLYGLYMIPCHSMFDQRVCSNTRFLCAISCAKLSGQEEAVDMDNSDGTKRKRAMPSKDQLKNLALGWICMACTTRNVLEISQDELNEKQTPHYRCAGQNKVRTMFYSSPEFASTTTWPQFQIIGPICVPLPNRNVYRAPRT